LNARRSNKELKLTKLGQIGTARVTKASSDSRTIIRLALFVPGGRQLAHAGVPGEWIENPRDGSFAESFSFGYGRAAASQHD
jgi:hypothetical protein